MKIFVVQLFAAVMVVAGLAALPGASGEANAATTTCPTTYVDSPPCGAPSSPSASATVTIGASVAAAAAGRVATTCSVAGLRGRALLTVSSSRPVAGGTLEGKFHRVGTPGSKKRKVSVASYSQPITKNLAPGVWHGTMVYKPAAGSSYQYCGIVFRNLRIKGAHRQLQQQSGVKVPTSVSAGLRAHAS